jgi:hypothetical protein
MGDLAGSVDRVDTLKSEALATRETPESARLQGEERDGE